MDIWKNGDKIQFPGGMIFVLDTWLNKEYYKNRGCINLSLRGRKAYTTFIKNHVRGKNGKFYSLDTLKENKIDWENMEKEIHNFIHGYVPFWPFNYTKQIIEIVKRNI